MDRKKLEEAARLIIEAVGDDPGREGLLETPKRFADMMEEQFKYCSISNDEIAREFDKTFESPESDMVVVKDIEIFSHCEHHIALMYDMSVSVAYIPKEKVLGLSKIARICDMASKRLQLQERIGSDIAEIMCEAAETDDVAVIIHGTHSCMSARGIKKEAASTVTTTFRGRFETDAAIQSQLTMMLHA